MANKTRYRSDDINLLLPTFRQKVENLIQTMQAAGFKPILWDGLRTPEEAARNAARGRGIENSMHLYGAAADIICDDHGWDCAKHGCRFFKRLGLAAEKAGFVWGGRFTRVDEPHVQGVTVRKQNEMRTHGTSAETAQARDALVRKHFRI